VTAFTGDFPPPALPILFIVLLVLAGNAMYVLRLASNGPHLVDAASPLDVCRYQVWAPASPNVGLITQNSWPPAAIDILHGHFPWWNYYKDWANHWR